MTIRRFKNKKLKKFFDSGDRSGIQPALAGKIALIFDRLDAATDPTDMSFPGSDFHLLKGGLKGLYSVHVNGNWVIVFRFENGEAIDVDFVDYH